MRFLDANVILRYLTRDDVAKARACYQLFQRVKRGDEELFTCEAIVTEVVYVLSSRRAPYRLSHEEIRARLVPILTLRGLRLPHKRVYVRALDLYASSPFLDFEDALAASHMEQRGVTEIVSYDKDFDRVAGLQRVEP
ncbi:MAG: type II toxin-antitoxin system VapC family toxin [Chloroflexi bacterium]|nr:type II toxin-antitoxin system VapC family toxin [Chloroflexota bacterium]MCY3939196.1 type II toxin-antitoxin system VapC family toxin [Chloroflexota bacterium]